MQFIFIGRPSSGKTSLSQRLCLKSSQKCHYVVNNSIFNEQYDTHFQTCSFKNVTSLTQASVIFEDVIQIPKSDLDQIYEVVNKCSRHQNLMPIFVLCHAILGNQIFSLVRSIPFIVFFATLQIVNVKSVLQHFQLDKKEIKKHIEQFNKVKDPHSFFLFNGLTGSFKPSSEKELLGLISSLNKKQESTFPIMEHDNSRADAILNGEKILRISNNNELSCHLFRMIIRKYSSDVDFNDYTLTLKGQDSQRMVKFSIIDLCNTAVSKNEEPNAENILFFKFILESLTPPQSLVINREFRKMLVKKSTNE